MYQEKLDPYADALDFSAERSQMHKHVDHLFDSIDRLDQKALLHSVYSIVCLIAAVRQLSGIVIDP